MRKATYEEPTMYEISLLNYDVVCASVTPEEGDNIEIGKGDEEGGFF